jgi:lipoprotein-releasing system permease protein
MPPLRTFLSFLGVMLGVAALIIVMAVMNGFRKELLDKILGLSGHVVVQKIGAPFDDHADAVTRLSAVPGVRSVVPLVGGQVIIASQSQTVGAFVRGLSEANAKSLPSVGRNIKFGTLEGFDGGEGIAIGTRLARDLGVTIGDGVTLIAPRGAQTPFGTVPANKRYTVSALFEMGMSEYDRTVIFMPIGEAQRYFRKGANVDAIEVMVADPQAMDSILPFLELAAGPSLHLSDWRRQNSEFFTVLEVERTMMFIIVSLVVVVAALNIVSALTMLVRSKSRDIAVLRTMGATKWSVMRVFLIAGATIGVVGTLAGLLLGIIFCQHIEAIRQFAQWATGVVLMNPKIYYLTRMPALIDSGEAMRSVIFAISMAVLAALIPAWRASRLDPIEALRYE